MTRTVRLSAALAISALFWLVTLVYRSMAQTRIEHLRATTGLWAGVVFTALALWLAWSSDG